MPRRRRPEPVAPPAAPTPDQAVVLISERKLKGLLATVRTKQAEIDSVNGSLREKIAYAADHDHLHTKAFSIIRQWDKMEAEKLKELWDTLSVYMDMSGLSARIAQVQPMVFSGSADAEDEAENEARAEQPSTRPRRAGTGFPMAVPQAEAAE